MYMCKDCGKVFLEDDVVKSYDDPSPSGVCLPTGYYTYYECPKCGSEDIDEATKCVSCGDWFVAEGEDKLCPDCAEYLTCHIDELMIAIGLYGDEFFEVCDILY